MSEREEFGNVERRCAPTRPRKRDYDSDDRVEVVLTSALDGASSRSSMERTAVAVTDARFEVFDWS